MARIRQISCMRLMVEEEMSRAFLCTLSTSCLCNCPNKRRRETVMAPSFASRFLPRLLAHPMQERPLFSTALQRLYIFSLSPPRGKRNRVMLRFFLPPPPRDKVIKTIIHGEHAPGIEGGCHRGIPLIFIARTQSIRVYLDQFGLPPTL